jgi:hypothetical protein
VVGVGADDVECGSVVGLAAGLDDEPPQDEATRPTTRIANRQEVVFHRLTARCGGPLRRNVRIIE